MMTLNHGLSGYVCGRAAMPLLRRYTRIPEGTLALACFLGAMLPDIDAVTNLLGSGLYFSGAWYGHRQASHSVLGTLVLALLAAWPLAIRLRRRGTASIREAYPALVIVFWLGGLLHIFGDLFTPRMPLPVLWPLSVRVGAFSHIGWFSPFLLWFFLGALAAEMLLRAMPGRGPGPARWRGVGAWGIHALAASGWIGYLMHSRYLSPEQWSAYQRSLLPEAMVGPLNEGVYMLWHWFVR